MKTTISHGTRVWVWIAIWTIPLICLLIVNYFYFNQNKFISIFSIISLTVPWIFFDKILERRYSEKIVIKLDYDLWSFSILKKGIEQRYDLRDIISYSINRSSNGFSSGLAFKFKFNNPKKISLVIYNKKQSEDQTDTRELLESFQSMIKNYNKIVDEDKKIIFAQTFAESAYGLVSIYVLLALLIIIVYVHIIYNKLGMLPISLLLGGGVLLRLLAQRKSDIRRRKNIT